ncbi:MULTISPECIES: histidine kinase [Paraburkholderia]|jgi:two-component system nitrate/nitrite sensor histidine kinase NarX|uniref:Sensor protein n=1 Tax=Paraburkholderia hospita TaxID=169430 RepID=A0AAJ4SZA5_9BURK|nr:histidine kinase [Paraburkholderia hospita]EUC15401.1 signal transduction histidine kinase, nitrate/nitrite-specific, NarQ [Burkholderia sp. BT03]SOE85583.1 Signal transduction histidine kinase, nitrate/nitrite-specific [Burkholderia sp. YR290]AUT70994.1 sensor histidine kinase [Paraburkholderia hospita]AXF02057.1 sensor histidine kinase [Paraburkholderia hospita]EIM98330.1 integral membrane sensor signal transduction histidine kinase [Paraburkholderia hospita]
MTTDQSATVHRYPLYAKVCSLLACIVALIALLYVSAFMQKGGYEGFRQTLFSLDEAVRLRTTAATLQTRSQDTANALTELADSLVRNDTLLNDWRQRGAPTPEIATLLPASTVPAAPDTEPAKTLAALKALRVQVAYQAQVHSAVLGLLQACTAFLLIFGVVSLAWGARRALVTRPHAALRALAETGQTVPQGRDEIDRLLKLQAQLAVRLRTEQDESTQLKRIVEDYIAFADQSLELLHHICAQLAEEEPSGRTLEALLQRLVGVLRVKRIALVMTESTAQLLDVDSVVSPNGDVPSIVRARVTSELMTLVGTHTFSPLDDGEVPPRVLAAPVRVPLATYGVLIAEGEPDTHFEQRHLYLLETIASVLAHAISNVSRDVRDRRMALFEERNSIARELHDSLAQSLSYMKIQLARLQAVLPPELSQSDIAEIAQGIREGIDSAYRQLRELLTTFRSPMHAHGLASTLEDLAEEFGSRSEVQISIDNRVPRMRLTVNEEMHVAQIVREALTNVIRHARATTAQVQLMSDGHSMTVSIDDDGRGIDRTQGDEHHYGLAIMRERARSLGGRLELKPAEQGSRVVLNFVPAALAAHKARGVSGATSR